jgi:hypothetical protein
MTDLRVSSNGYAKSRGQELHGMHMVLAMAAVIAAGLAGTGPATAGGARLTCGDLRRAAEPICMAKVQCSAVEAKVTLWAEKLCACLAEDAPDDHPVGLGIADFDPLMFSCCAGNAIMTNRSRCERQPG